MPLRNPVKTVLVSRVMADIPDEIFNYFFAAKGPCVFTASRGPRQFIIAQFFEKLHEECVNRGIPPRWEPENEDRVQEILDDMNFEPTGYTTTEGANPRTND